MQYEIVPRSIDVMRMPTLDHPDRADLVSLSMNPARRRLLALAALAAAGTRPARAAAPACTPLLAREFPRLQDEKTQNLCQYAGQVILVVNTASFCGFTPQYKSLEALFAHIAGYFGFLVGSTGVERAYMDCKVWAMRLKPAATAPNS